jgi:hypothetical protein
MHAYQANAIASEQSFGMFYVNEGMPVPWPAPAPPLTATYNNTSPPQTPRQSTTYEEPFTPSQPRVMMTSSRIPLPESPMTPGFGNYSQPASQSRGRYSMETPGTGRRNLPEFMDNYTPATFRHLDFGDQSMHNEPQSTPGNNSTPRFATPAMHQETRRASFAPIPEENKQPSQEEPEPLEGLSYVNSPNHRPANPELNG